MRVVRNELMNWKARQQDTSLLLSVHSCAQCLDVGPGENQNSLTLTWIDELLSLAAIEDFSIGE